MSNAQKTVITIIIVTLSLAATIALGVFLPESVPWSGVSVGMLTGVLLVLLHG